MGCSSSAASHIDPYSGIVRKNLKTREYRLVIGYLTESMPADVIKMVYMFYYGQLRLIKGNNFCIIKPTERIFTTMGYPKNYHNTFVKITKPLNYGIAEFEIECIVSAGMATAIGVITNLDANISSSSWLFDHILCGESFQMYLSAESDNESTQNGISHFNRGRTQYFEDISSIKSDKLKNGQKVKLILDFIANEIKFFIDSLRVGKPMKITKNQTYYAVFEYLVYYPFYSRIPAQGGAAAYRLCSTPTFP